MRTLLRRVAEFAACSIAILFSITAASAATLILPIESQSVLSGANGTTCILINFGALDTLAGKRIHYAKCSLKIGHDSCTGLLEGMDAKPVVGRASALASGSVRLPDSTEVAFADAYSKDADVGQGAEGDTEILLTELLQAWVDGRLANNGLVLLPRSTGCVYALLARSNYPGEGYGKLLVKFADKSQ